MPGKLTLQIVAGAMAGEQFEFDKHNTFILGRSSDCHMSLPDDTYVSRHHFILEANPPDARIRDMGSLNGTYVNGIKYGSREEDETPEQGVKRQYPEVDLKDGDRVKVGDTEILLKVELPAVCCQCDSPIPDKMREKCAWIGGTYICLPCKKKNAASIKPAKPAKPPRPPRCQQCGKDVAKEIGRGRRGKYVCNSCRAKAESDPAKLLRIMLMEALGGRHSPPDIAGYEIEKKLGQGGMGAVYLARRKKDNKRAALKVMLSKVAVDEGARKGFKREMDVLRKLRHENVVEFIDHGSAGTAFYFVMEFCDGGSLDDLMRQHGGKISLDIAGHIMLQTLEGLAYAHDHDFVHRDLKPPNLLLHGTPGRWTAKVTDFGLAKNFQDAGLSGFTVTGQMAGTPVFMPPEQPISFKYAKPVIDIWSMGATFYNVLTGRLPRNMRRGQDPIEMVLSGEIIPIRKRNSSIPKKLAEVIDRSLDRNPKARYQTAGKMRKALEKVL